MSQTLNYNFGFSISDGPNDIHDIFSDKIEFSAFYRITGTVPKKSETDPGTLTLKVHPSEIDKLKTTFLIIKSKPKDEKITYKLKKNDSPKPLDLDQIFLGKSVVSLLSNQKEITEIEFTNNLSSDAKVEILMGLEND